MPRFSPRNVIAKTSSYSVLAEDGGAIFTTRGAGGTVTFTLPATASLPVGWSCRFINCAAQTMTVASPDADTMTTFNDLTADSVSYQTSSELIGGAMEVVWDGTGWLVFLMAEETQTVTVAT